MNIQSRLAIQQDDNMISLNGDLIVIPLIRFEFVVARGFRGSHDGAGVVARGLLFPDLNFVAAVLLR